MSEESNFTLSCQPLYKLAQFNTKKNHLGLWLRTEGQREWNIHPTSWPFGELLNGMVFDSPHKIVEGTGIVPWLGHLRTKEKEGQLAMVHQDSDWDQENVHNWNFSYRRDGEEWNIPSKPWTSVNCFRGQFLFPLTQSADGTGTVWWG